MCVFVRFLVLGLGSDSIFAQIGFPLMMATAAV